MRSLLLARCSSWTTKLKLSKPPEDEDEDDGLSFNPPAPAPAKVLYFFIAVFSTSMNEFVVAGMLAIVVAGCAWNGKDE
jgi:hypothetical protein